MDKEKAREVQLSDEAAAATAAANAPQDVAVARAVTAANGKVAALLAQIQQAKVEQLAAQADQRSAEQRAEDEKKTALSAQSEKASLASQLQAATQEEEELKQKGAAELQAKDKLKKEDARHRSLLASLLTFSRKQKKKTDRLLGMMTPEEKQQALKAIA